MQSKQPEAKNRTSELQALIVDLQDRIVAAELELAPLLTERKIGERIRVEGREVEIVSIGMSYGRCEVRYRKVLKNGSLHQNDQQLYSFDRIG